MKKLIVVLCLVWLVSGCGQPASDSQTEKAQPSAPADALAQGIQYLQGGDVTSAVKSFEEAIQQNPVDPQPYMVLGQTYMRLNEYARAIEVFSAALRVSPNKGEVYYLLAVNYGLAGDVEIAKKNAEASIEIFRQNKDEQNFVRALSLLQGLAQTKEPVVPAPPPADNPAP